LVVWVFVLMKSEVLETIKSLVGKSITQENLKFIDAFISPRLSLFMPIGGSCGYAVTPDHQHPAYMFLMGYDDETKIVIEGKSIESSPNTIFYLSPNIQHHEVQNYLPPKYCAIFIEKDFFEEIFTLYKKEILYFKGLVVDIKSYKIDALIRDFIYESQHKSLAQETILNSIAMLLTHEIIRNIIKYKPQMVLQTDNMIINEAIKFINLSYEQEITIEILSNRSNLSRSHFTKLFTDAMQVSPMVYLRTIRLQNAKKMLQTQKLTVTEVAQQCGFNSTSYFTKIFKENFLETPKEFMRRFG